MQRYHWPKASNEAPPIRVVACPKWKFRCESKSGGRETMNTGAERRPLARGDPCLRCAGDGKGQGDSSAAWAVASAPRAHARGECFQAAPHVRSRHPVGRHAAAGACRRRCPARRVLWGRDWPHPNQYDEMQNDGDLLDAFAQWVPEEHMRRHILVKNPAALYGFG